jgi:hypothetical protein
VQSPVEHARKEGGGGSAEVAGTVVAAPCREGVVGVASLLGDAGRVAAEDDEERHRGTGQAEALQGGDHAAPARDGADHDGRGGDRQAAQGDVEDWTGSEGGEQEKEGEGGQQRQEAPREGPQPHPGQRRLEAERREGQDRPARRGESGRGRQERHEERGARVGSHPREGRRARRV